VATDGYEKKLGQLADELKERFPDRYGLDDGGDNCVSHGLLQTFEMGIYSFAWSPDSRTLAFAAQMNGLSSDVYLYDIETGAVQQAEESLQSVTGIRWSPDGKKIVFENSEPAHWYSGVRGIHVIIPGKQVVKNSPTLYLGPWVGTFDESLRTWLAAGDWLSPNELLVAG